MRDEPELSKSQTEIIISGASINEVICTMDIHLKFSGIRELIKIRYQIILFGHFVKIKKE